MKPLRLIPALRTVTRTPRDHKCITCTSSQLAQDTLRVTQELSFWIPGDSFEEQPVRKDSLHLMDLPREILDQILESIAVNFLLDYQLDTPVYTWPPPICYANWKLAIAFMAVFTSSSFVRIHLAALGKGGKEEAFNLIDVLDICKRRRIFEAIGFPGAVFRCDQPQLEPLLPCGPAMGPGLSWLLAFGDLRPGILGFYRNRRWAEHCVRRWTMDSVRRLRDATHFRPRSRKRSRRLGDNRLKRLQFGFISLEGLTSQTDYLLGAKRYLVFVINQGSWRE